MDTSFPVIDLAATGKNITRLREARGLSVTDVQRYFGFEAPQAIYKWQKGKSLPSVDNLFALSYLLEVPLDELLVPRESGFSILPQEKSRGSDFFGFSVIQRSDSSFHFSPASRKPGIISSQKAS